MNRFTLCGLFGLITAALFTLSGTTPARQDDKKSPTQPVGGQKVAPFLECAQAADSCARTCEECGAHCAKLVSEGKKEHLETLKTCQDCATICSTTSHILARQGPFSDTIVLACAQACRRCGDECEKHASDPVMKRCADECRQCEKACLALLKHMGHDPNGSTKK